MSSLEPPFQIECESGLLLCSFCQFANDVACLYWQVLTPGIKDPEAVSIPRGSAVLLKCLVLNNRKCYRVEAQNLKLLW